MVTGESILVRLDSLLSISLALSQSSFTLLSSMNSLLLTLLRISSTNFISFFIIIQKGYNPSAPGKPLNDGQQQLIMLFRQISYKAHSLLNPIRYFLSQFKADILSSNYHMLGPGHFKKGRHIQKLLSSQLSTIDSLQHQLHTLRNTVKQASQAASQAQPLEVKQYVELYERLIKAIQQCEINNEWIYNVISWYNMTPFYKILLERLLKAKRQQVYYLVNAMHAMKYDWQSHQQQITSIYNQNDSINNFYKHLSHDFELALLLKMENMLRSPLTYYKRRYYQKYVQQNIESILKNMKFNEEQSVTELLWLFEAYIKTMNDNEVLVAKIEKYIITTRIHLSHQNVERLMNAYSLKGKIHEHIYREYIKPYIVQQKMKDLNHLAQTLRFLVCCQANDRQLLQKVFENIYKCSQPYTILLPRSLFILHTYTRYLTMKGMSIPLSKKMQSELKTYCKNRVKGQVNSIGKLVNDLLYKRGLGSKQKSTAINECSAQGRLNRLSPQQMKQFQDKYSYKMATLSFKRMEVYKDAHFCCFDLEYCIHSTSTSQITDLQTNSIECVFTSGSLTREARIREQMLSYFGVKVHYFNSLVLKSKARKSVEQEAK